MTLWILWSIVASMLFSVAAVAGERIASLVQAPRRFIWLTAMVAASVVPALLALRHAPAPAPSAPELPHVVVASPTKPVSAVPLRTDRMQRAATSALPHPSTAATSPQAELKPATSRSFSITTLWRRARTNITALVRVADPWVMRAWLLASIALLTAFFRSLLALRTLRSRWSETETDVGRVFVAQEAGPAVVGFLRPRIVIPVWALSFSRASRDMLLRHELEHVRAGDSRSLLSSELLRVLFPWNAALWWMGRRLRLALEIDCDTRVLRAGATAHEYGLLLLAVGERYATSLPLAASLSEPHLNLQARIEEISAPRVRRPIAASLPFAMLVLVVLTAAAQVPRPLPLLRATSRTAAYAPLRNVRLRENPPASSPRELPPINGATRDPLTSNATLTQPFEAPMSATLPGLKYTIRAAGNDTSLSSLDRALENFDGVVTFAGGRGRIDIVEKTGAPPTEVRGVRVAGPTAQPGDYYLFDSTAFVLVRPSTGSFSRIALTQVSNRDSTAHRHTAKMRDTSDQWLWSYDDALRPRSLRNHVPVFWVAQSDRADFTALDWSKLSSRDGEISIENRRSEAHDTALAAGHFAFSDAPSGEVGVSQWFGLTEAIADIRAVGRPLPVGHFWLTSFSTWLSGRGPELIGVAAEFSGVHEAAIDPTTLLVPSQLHEVPWPGLDTILPKPQKPDNSAVLARTPDKTRDNPLSIAFKQIVITPKGGPESRAAARAKAESLLVVLKNGGDFAAVVRQESMDPLSRDNGGALPFVKRGQLVDSFDRAIFSGAPQGTLLTNVVETPFGFHIVRIDHVEQSQVKVSHVLIAPTLDSNDVASAQRVADTVWRRWSAGTPYDTLVKYYHDPTETEGTSDRYSLDALPDEYRKALAGVKTGQLTLPFAITNARTGALQFVVALVTSRGECPVYIVDGVEQPSTCGVPFTTATPKPNVPSGCPVYIVDGVEQLSTCAKPAFRDSIFFFKVKRNPR
jgi:beta-lactamase regulating signal transducer with metallopeptidase domain